MSPVPAELIHSIARMPLTMGQRLLLCRLAAQDGPMTTNELIAALHTGQVTIRTLVKPLVERKILSERKVGRDMVYQLEAIR